MKRIYILLLAITQVFVLTACHSVSSYTGDGQLIDLGPVRLTTRYVVRLGNVNFRAVGTSIFYASGMPPSQYVLGLRFESNVCQAMQSDTRITMDMTNEKGERVVHETHALRDLTWTYSLESKCDKHAEAYVMSKSVEVTSSNGDSNHRQTFTGADSASGGYFRSRENGRYRVAITVHSSAEVLGPATVVLTES